MVAGAKGELLMANFETLASGPGTASHPQPRYIHVAPGCTAVPPSISLLEVDVSGLIRMKPDALMSNQPLAPVAKPAQGTRSPKRPGTPVFPSTAAAAAGAQGAPLPAIAVKKTSRPGGGEAAALATALAVLHIWGIDDVADKQMIGMVASLGLLRWSHSGTGESSSRPPGGMAQEQLRIAPSMGLFQVSVESLGPWLLASPLGPPGMQASEGCSDRRFCAVSRYSLAYVTLLWHNLSPPPSQFGVVGSWPAFVCSSYISFDVRRILNEVYFVHYTSFVSY